MEQVINAPQVNIPLLRKQVETVEREAALPRHKRGWVQSMWITVRNAVGVRDKRSVPGYTGDERVYIGRLSPQCGTAGCLAGNTVMDAGYDTFMFVEMSDGRAVAATIIDEDGDEISVVNKACELLGLTPAQGDALFEGSNNAERIRLLAEDIAGERL